MIKTIATPINNNFNLMIPNNYIGRKIEIIYYALDEIVEEKSTKTSMADLWGSISDETAQKIHNEVIKSREGWDDRINNQI